MKTSERATVVAVFENDAQAGHAVEELRHFGFHDDQLQVARRCSDVGIVSDDVSQLLTSAGIGAGLGAFAGGLLAWVLIAGAFLDISLAANMASTNLVLALAAGGGILGALLGAFFGLNIPEKAPAHHEGAAMVGGTIVTVEQAAGVNDEVWDVLHRNGAYDWDAPSEMSSRSTPKKRELLSV